MDDVGCLCISIDGRGLPEGAGEALDADQVADAEPLLVSRCAAGVVIPARHADPAGAVSAWADEARRHGARIRVGCPVRSLLRDGGRIAGAVTDEGAIYAGCTVLATGWETPRLAAGLGIDVPVRGVRGWIVTTRPAPVRLRRPLNEVDFSGGVAASRYSPLATLRPAMSLRRLSPPRCVRTPPDALCSARRSPRPRAMRTTTARTQSSRSAGARSS
jgi:glycine/D-amino acid oxidase-like deaminating enzyme